MADKLADETLAAILADSLSVPEQFFACTCRSGSPLTSEELSSSTVLLVCKRWLRVATPLLYETVILCSAAQSTALARVLKKQTAFGRYIRKLRVEGGVGASICKVFKAAPNITDLCLTLDLYSDDKVTSMYKCLFDSVSPRRLVLCSAGSTCYYDRNKMIATAIDSLVRCISEWTTLRVVTLAVAVLQDPGIYNAVCAAEQLELIHLPETSCSHDDPRSFISQLAGRCLAPTIRVGWPEHNPNAVYILPPAPLSSAAQAKIRFALPKPERPAEVIAMPSTSSYTPLSNISKSTRRVIWTRILDLVISHTTGVDIYRATRSLEQTAGGVHEAADLIAALPRGPVLQCMSVCKEWKEIVGPLACRDLRFTSMNKATNFMEWVTTHVDALALLCSVRSVRLSTVREGHGQGLATLCDDRFTTDFCNLEEFFGESVLISPKALSALPTAHLRTLTITSDSGTFELPSFPSLRALDWTIESFSGGVNRPSAENSPAMPSLETLVVSGMGAPSILKALSAFSLPSITSLTFQGNAHLRESILRSFCSAHGGSIRTVINLGDLDMLATLLPTCPGLTVLSVTSVELPTLAKSLRQLNSPHVSLEEMKIAHLSQLGERYRKSRAQEDAMQEFTDFCNALDPAKFPALRTVRVSRYGLWPETQRDIANHPLPALAEKMLERGVRIVDHAGKGWKPRLTRAKMK